MKIAHDLGRWSVRAAAVVAAAVCGATVLAAPSYADVTVTVGQGGAFYDDCKNVAYSASFSHPLAATWSSEAIAYAPSGAQATDPEVITGSGDTGTAAGHFHVCFNQGAGEYRADVVVTYFDGDGNVIGGDSTEGFFDIRAQRTRTYLRASDASPKYNSIVRLTATSKEERAGGWRRNDGERVKLEARCDKTGWFPVKQSTRTTDSLGKASWRYRWNIRVTCSFRAVTLPRPWSAKSASDGVKINPWGRVAGTAALRTPWGMTTP